MIVNAVQHADENKQCVRGDNGPRPVTLIFDLESGVLVTFDVRGLPMCQFSLPIYIGLSVFDFGPMYATDRRQTASSLMPPQSHICSTETGDNTNT